MQRLYLLPILPLPFYHGSNHIILLSRLFLAYYDQQMRVDCNYQDQMPYWDWSVDSQAPDLSTIWSDTAFSGNQCPKSPFWGTMYSVVPNTHNVCRNWASSDLSTSELGKPSSAIMGAIYAPAQISLILSLNTDYDNFRQSLESLPHNYVHDGISGDMGNPSVSPNDPIFYLHHR